MALVTSDAIVDGFRGKFGKSFVFRTLRDKTFVSHAARKPDKKKETEAQRGTRVTFRKASEWARMILKDPEQKAYYLKRAKVLKLPNAYTAALTDYMRKPKVQKVQYSNTVSYTVYKPGFTLKDVQVTTAESTEPAKNITISQYKDQWIIKHALDAVRDSVSLVTIDRTGKTRIFKVT